MEAAILRFLKSLEAQGRSASTLKAYRWWLGRYARWCEEAGVDFRKASYQDMERFRDWLVAQGIQPQSRRQTITAVRSFYDFLAREGEVPANPVPRGLR
ncbi:site-specific recombinase XerD [Thermaerobacter subterraneus DSM 13965]|uniref:Site-specific recombinase XerD n=2 Tax=Thermaerobacter TaxID=73918 RepID=K6Q092_9FIRM|nr:site-specific recombinase XerD [Thermaerobacter subterraneus DSM 13965]